MTSPEHPSSKSGKREPFSELRNAFDSFFMEKPIKGILQSMDDLFTLSFTDRNIPIEVLEKENEYLVTAKLPGIPKQQINIEMIKQSLVLTVIQKEELEKRNDKNTVLHREQSLRTLSRTISFSKPIDDKNITANHRDGLLLVTVPKIKGKQISITE